MQQFANTDLPLCLTQALTRLKFTTPTPIQAQAIPKIIAGKDILGTAQTGTGKTGAFAIPIVAKLLMNPKQSALILTPTRELATQVVNAFHQLLTGENNIQTCLLIGGELMSKQLKQLKKRPQIIVGTPGRINDHLERRTLNLTRTDFLVLDEMDRMLDMGFSEQLETIIAQLPKTRQTLMFSATLPKHILKLANQYLNEPTRIEVGTTIAPADQLTQELIRVAEDDKYNQLLIQLNQRSGSIIVFVKTKRSADRLALQLSKQNYQARAIHGDLRQQKRNRVIDGFRKLKFSILVATDVAARGLDIPHIEHVINYDLPQQPEDYIHRIGRTARAGATGAAVNFVSPKETHKWSAIDYLMNPDKKPPPSEASTRNRKRHRPHKNKNQQMQFKKFRPRNKKSASSQS